MEFFDELANTYFAQDDNFNMCDGIYTEGVGGADGPIYTQAVFD